jgi:hypothetical protein
MPSQGDFVVALLGSELSRPARDVSEVTLNHLLRSAHSSLQGDFVVALLSKPACIALFPLAYLIPPFSLGCRVTLWWRCWMYWAASSAGLPGT